MYYPFIIKFYMSNNLTMSNKSLQTLLCSKYRGFTVYHFSFRPILIYFKCKVSYIIILKSLFFSLHVYRLWPSSYTDMRPVSLELVWSEKVQCKIIFLESDQWPNYRKKATPPMLLMENSCYIILPFILNGSTSSLT
jgi:hypothetical protein